MSGGSAITGIVDTHCHLTHPRLAGDEAEVVARAHAAGVTACVTIGTGVDDAVRARDLSRRHPGFVSCTAGLDPFSSHAAGSGFDEELSRLGELLRGGGFVAVGEIGLDYHYDLDPRPVQAERFERQLDLAAELGLPVVIHVRDAHEDMISVLAAHTSSRGVIHSFTAGPEQAARYLELGWWLAFNGVLTFKNAETVREAGRAAPADRILLETDSPYLAPMPRRGERCEPAYAAITLRALAAARGEDVHEVARRTTANAAVLFGPRSA